MKAPTAYTGPLAGSKILREHETLLFAYGCSITAVRQRKHRVLHCRTAGGRHFVLTVSTSPSDRYALRNIERDIRKAVRS